MEAGTYTAIEVAAPGKLSKVRRPLRDPGTGEARIRVEACGVCHSDSATVDGVFPGLTYPRVPGHEVVGRIEALGSSWRRSWARIITSTARRQTRPLPCRPWGGPRSS